MKADYEFFLPGLCAIFLENELASVLSRLVLTDGRSNAPKVTENVVVFTTSENISMDYIRKIHINTFHTGRKKLKGMLKAHKGVNVNIDEAVSDCIICQKYSNKSNPRLLLKGHKLPLYSLSMGIIKLPKTNSG
jgi:hypothetical protein